MAEQFSWVPLPYCSPPKCPFPIKSLALSAHVSPQTSHFRLLDKSSVSDPGRGPPSCNSCSNSCYCCSFFQLLFGGPGSDIFSLRVRKICCLTNLRTMSLVSTCLLRQFISECWARAHCQALEGLPLPATLLLVVRRGKSAEGELLIERGDEQMS